MAKDFFGTKVIVTGDSGRKRLKWATLMSGLVGGPLYAFATGTVGNINVLGDGLVAGVRGSYGWVADEITLLFAGPRFGIQAAWSSFIRESAQFGVLAYVLSVLGGMLAIFLILKGVTAING